MENCSGPMTTFAPVFCMDSSCSNSSEVMNLKRFLYSCPPHTTLLGIWGKYSKLVSRTASSTAG
jgi:hypothetical protein